MYILSFRLIAPRKLLEAQLFNQQYQHYEDITNVSDRLRWCRYHMGLMQKEVAERGLDEQPTIHEDVVARAFGYILPTTGRIPNMHRLEMCTARCAMQQAQ